MTETKYIQRPIGYHIKVGDKLRLSGKDSKQLWNVIKVKQRKNYLSIKLGLIEEDV